MNSASHEHLLGYVLDALEPHEHEQLERELADNPRLRAQLAEISASMQPLECCRETELPPRGLAARTCAFVHEQAAAVEKVTPARAPLPAAMSAGYAEAGGGSRWTLVDLVVTAGIFVATAMLFFPAIAHSRYQAQMAQCRNNLRILGHAFASWNNAHGEYPVPETSGPHSGAGVQAAMLYENGHLEHPSVMLCPSSPLARRGTWTLPQLKEMRAARGEELARLQRQVGGSLAFTLGYRHNDRYTCRGDDCQSKATFALASDAPSGSMPDMVSGHHDGQGQNVVFADEHVDYIKGCGEEACGDSLFWNHDGQIAAGKDPNDNVLANSGVRAFPFPILLPLQNDE